MTTQSSSFLCKLWRSNFWQTVSGFTLTELLATILIGGIAMTGLLAAMVELLKTDQQEAIREETQQEMQTALSFIAEDLRESVYVYDGTQTRGTPAVNIPYDTLPNFSGTGTPIIAFWKAEALTASQQKQFENISSNSSPLKNCSTAFSTNNDKKAECDNLKLKRRAYSLVVYLQVREPNPGNLSSIWKGKSRILRYELPQYKNSDFSNLTWSKGFVDPARTNNFPGWPFDAQNTNNLQSASNGGTGLPVLSESPAEVLVDFVDDPISSNAPDCPNPPAPATPIYQRLPSNATNNNSFFACVRTVGTNLGENQDILLYLRGNTYGRGGSTENDTLSTLQTRVTLRGVIDKFN